MGFCEPWVTECFMWQDMGEEREYRRGWWLKRAIMRKGENPESLRW